jgi:hypothetical protein
MGTKNMDKDVNISINVPSNNGNTDGYTTKVNVIAKHIKTIVSSLANASYVKIFKVFISTILFLFCSTIGFFVYNLSKNQQAVNTIIDEMIVTKKEDEANMKIRDAVTPQIDNELKKIMYTAHADRIAIFELHNGKENATRLPFRYADMSYEQVNDNDKSISYVSDGFQNIPLTHYTIPFYIAENTYFVGNIEEVRLIDKRFADLMNKIGGKYMSSVILRNDGSDIGFLCLFYDTTVPMDESKKEVGELLKHMSDKISPLLDLRVQKKKYKNGNQFN